jgi:drug/metabolite transporter (DMT)-like permease
MPSAAIGPALLVCLLAVSYGAGGSYVERTFRDAPPYAGALCANVLGVVLVLPFGIAGVVAHPPTVEALGAAAMAGLLTNGVGFLAYFTLIRRVGAARSLSVVYAVPVVAIVLGVLLLGESIDVADIVGLALISISLAFVGRG